MDRKIAFLDIIHYGQGLLEAQNVGGLARADPFRSTDIFLITL